MWVCVYIQLQTNAVDDEEALKKKKKKTKAKMKRGALSVAFIYTCQDKGRTSHQKQGFRTDSLNGFDCLSVDLSWP